LIHKQKNDSAVAVGLLTGPLDSLESDVSDLRSVDRALQAMGKAPETERTGDISFTFGILNDREPDGVAENRGTLRFKDGALLLTTDSYTVVKAHSFAEVKFSVVSSGDAQQLLKKWKNL
jgi:hypothetical protein